MFNVIFKKMTKVFNYEALSNEAIRKAVDSSTMKKTSKIYAASRLAKFFSIDLTIKIFGYPIIEWHYPPQGSDEPVIDDSNDSMFND